MSKNKIEEKISIALAEADPADFSNDLTHEDIDQITSIVMGVLEPYEEALNKCREIFDKDYYFGHPTARKGLAAINMAMYGVP